MLLLLGAFLTTALFAQQKSQGGIYLNKKTHFIISNKTQVVTPANLNIHSSITGKGQLKLCGKKQSDIDAHNQSIENLTIVKDEMTPTRLISAIHITNSFNVESGTLCLFDYDMFLENDAKLNIGKFAHVRYLGSGKIIHNAHPQLLVNQYSPFQLKLFLSGEPGNTSPGEYEKEGFYYSSIKIRNFNRKPPTPPA